MDTGIFIRVNGKDEDIGDPKLDIVVLCMYIEAMLPIMKTRTIMTLLGRRVDFEEYIVK